MIINDAMVDALYKIRCIESEQVCRDLNIPDSQLANALIHLYDQTENVHSRELITEFMTQAGVTWLRKLLTNDTAPIASTGSMFASLDDYLELLAGNDSSIELTANYG